MALEALGVGHVMVAAGGFRQGGEAVAGRDDGVGVAFGDRARHRPGPIGVNENAQGSRHLCLSSQDRYNHISASVMCVEGHPSALRRQ